jgi:hypothetical protein
LFVETGNVSLEQSAAILDGEDVKEALVKEVARTASEGTDDVAEVPVSSEKKTEL